MAEEMKTWCENILTPINKLFTHFRKRRADAQEESHAHRPPTPPPVPSGHNAVRLEQFSSWGAVGRQGTRHSRGTSHVLAQAYVTWMWLRILPTPLMCADTAGPTGTWRSTEDGAAAEASTNHMCDGGLGAATRATGPSESPLPLKDGASDSGWTPMGVSVTSLCG